MTYGSSAYGSTALGGAAASEWFTFFPLLGYAPDVLHKAEMEFTGSDQLFSLFVSQSNETGEGTSYKAYTANDPSETPQLQVTFAGVGQTVIGAARFITVTVELDSAVWAGGLILSIRGRRGD